MMTVRDAWRVVESTATRGISIDTTGAGDLRCYAYSELIERSAQAAAALRKRGVGRRDLVLISAVTSPAFIVTWIALMRMGAVPVPVPPKETLAGQGAFRQRMEPLLRHHRFYVCREADAEDLPPSPPGEIVIVRLEQLEAEIGAARAPDAAPPVEWPELDDEAFVQYTSGSTGRPKGTVITYRNLFANLRAMAAGLELEPSRDTFLSWLPLYHDMGLVGKLLNSMFHTASLVLVPPQAFVKDPLGFLALMDRCRAQICSMPNFAIEWILRAIAAGRPAEVRLDAMKWLGVGSEPIHAGTLRRFQAEMAGRGLRPTALSPCYGMAEATLAVSMSRPSAAHRVTYHEGAEVPCVGSVLPGFEVRIVPMEGEGEGKGMKGAGRILIRGESVSRHARVGDQRVTRVEEGGFHDTGDIGLFAGDELVVLGRADEMFIVNGVNHFPYDIEDVVRGMPELECRRAACFGLPGPEPGARPRVVIVFEGSGGGPGGRERVEEAIRSEILSRFGLRVDEVLAVKRRLVPVTTSGKIQRRRAMELYTTGYFHDNQA